MNKAVKASNAKAKSLKAKNGTVTTIGSGNTKVLGNERKRRVQVLRESCLGGAACINERALA